MKLGGLFGKQTTAASAALQRQKMAVTTEAPVKTALEKVLDQKPKPGQFIIDWGQPREQGIKDYQPILTLVELEAYLKRCEVTGIGSFDYETAGDENHRIPPNDAEGNQIKGKALEDWLKSVNLDPWRADVSTMSISAAPDESRVIPLSHKEGRVFEPSLTREEARKVFFDTVDRLLFRNKNIVKIAVNLGFETKFTAKYGKYILMPVADPLMMWVRCLQVAAPHRLYDQQKPSKGWGLKPATKAVFKVEMSEFNEVLQKHNVLFFDEIAADQGDGLNYSAEDSDYGAQHYFYWREIAMQIPGKSDPDHPGYDKWLHEIEMPFQRVLGLMEYWGMRWDKELAGIRKEEAAIVQEQAAEEIKRIVKDTFGLDINTGKSGKTGDMSDVLFNRMKLPATKFGVRGASTDKESLIDIEFMLDHKLEDISEEKYLAVPLPDDWQQEDKENDLQLDKEVKMAIRIAKRPDHPYKDVGKQLIELLRKIQKYSTLLSTHILGREEYLSDVTQRIHASYAVWTDTARCNCFHPNGQNVPRMDKDELKIRNFYVPAPGKVLFFIDFAGFELRIIAWKSQDEIMIELFNNDGDMHRRTAATMTGKTEAEVTKKERTDAKPGNFGITYGGTEHALQKTFKVEYGIRKTLDECFKIVKAVKETYKRIPEFQQAMIYEAREKGWIATMKGYIRLLPGMSSTLRGERDAAGRAAGNTPIQGTAADIMKRSQNDVYEAIGLGTAMFEHSNGKMLAPLRHGHTDMIAQIHDEIIFEMDDDPDVVEAAYKWIKKTMEKPPCEDFPVPVLAEASIGYRWGEKVSVEKWLEDRRKQLTAN